MEGKQETSQDGFPTIHIELQKTLILQIWCNIYIDKDMYNTTTAINNNKKFMSLVVKKMETEKLV